MLQRLNARGRAGLCEVVGLKIRHDYATEFDRLPISMRSRS
jgi:hypothetical protein